MPNKVSSRSPPTTGCGSGKVAAVRRNGTGERLVISHPSRVTITEAHQPERLSLPLQGDQVGLVGPLTDCGAHDHRSRQELLRRSFHRAPDLAQLLYGDRTRTLHVLQPPGYVRGAHRITAFL